MTYHPQRGYFVTELPATAIADIYVVRELIESQTEELALPRLTEQNLADMDKTLPDQARAVDEQDAVEMIAANRRFHFVIFDRLENIWLRRFVAQLWDTLDRYRVLSYRRMWLDDSDRHVPGEILNEHERILNALFERDNGEQALTLLQRHRERSETLIETLVPAPERVSEPE